MEIKSVKIQGECYLLNNEMYVPKADGNREYELIKIWLKDNEPEPEYTKEELDKLEAERKLQETKEAKARALSTITVEVDGKLFDGNEPARLNIMSAIQSSELFGLTETVWKLADNTSAVVTLDELKMALSLSIQEVGRIVMVSSIEEV